MFERVKLLREARGWSQEKTAQEILVPLERYRGCEQGYLEDDHEFAEILRALCKLYRVNFNYLMGLTEIADPDFQPGTPELTSQQLQEIKKKVEKTSD